MSVNTTEEHFNESIESKRYLAEIIFFIGERFPSKTDNMLSVSATESAAIFEQFPGFFVQFDKF